MMDVFASAFHSAEIIMQQHVPPGIGIIFELHNSLRIFLCIEFEAVLLYYQLGNK